VEFLPLVGIALLFWLFIIRPTSKRQRELRTMQSSLDVGDEVVLTSGIFGTVRALDEGEVRVEVAPTVTIKVARAAIGSIATKHDQPAEAPDTEQQAGGLTGPEES
jgi:preprotein translocase subunit YajC